MNYIKSNKEAWEEAFDHRKDNWGDSNHKELLSEELPFLNLDVIGELKMIDFNGKKIAQFCCNNGRELLSIMQLGAEEGIGFDIAKNILDQATETAKKINCTNCKFILKNILDIGDEYNNYFDFIIFTVGAITWFEDLDLLFKKVSDCLKADGILFINDFHPVTNMLSLPGDESFNKNNLKKFMYSYFQTEPWIENSGMKYISNDFKSKTFTSFSHTMSSQINAIVDSKMTIIKLLEYDYDIGLSDLYDKLGIPLSFILMAKKDL